MTEKWIFAEDAISEAQTLTDDTGTQHYVFYEEPPITGPAGACYRVGDDRDSGRAIWPDRTSEARRRGYQLGYDIAHEYLLASPEELEEPIETCDDLIAATVSGYHDHTAQYSPAEFYAKEYNDSRDPDDAWQALDTGLSAGARRRWQEARQ